MARALKKKAGRKAVVSAPRNTTPEKRKGAVSPHKQESASTERPGGDRPPSSEVPPFPVVGIGASAGGLEALEQFIGQVPRNSGMAFVIVQHLDPTHKDILAELLQRTTSMPVVQVKDRLKVRPDHAYVIPPDKDMSILHGVLHLLAPAASRGLRLPIDYFLRSLAQDQGERGIGVILSGMGSDGSLGLRAIKEKGGAIFVQEPETAKFDSMPRSAIDTALADVVAPAQALPGKIINYVQHIRPPAGEPVEIDDKSENALEKITILLRARTGNDFSLYKKNTVLRRIERRMTLHQLSRISDYLRYLRENPHEADLLFKELLIGVTSFFRDPAAWEQLKNEVLPALLATAANGAVLRAWVPGCSTGEEAYSLAMIFLEAIERQEISRHVSLQIFATDLDEDAIERARAGVYPANIAADVPEERLRRFFTSEDHSYRIKKEIRNMVVYATQNVIADPPFTRLDILSCRNLLIYLSSDLQKKLLPLFYYSIKPRGYLFLGSAESIGSFTDLFSPLSGKKMLFQRLDTAPRERLAFPAAFAPAALPPPPERPAESREPKPALSIQALTDALVLQRFAPAAVLTSSKGDVLYISGRTGKYLEPAAGKANWNIFAMARHGLRHVLSETIQKAQKRKTAITTKDVRVGNDGNTILVNITVQPLSDPEILKGMLLLVFSEVGSAPRERKTAGGKKGPAANTRLAELEQQLTDTRLELQTAHERMQTFQEEVLSSNEELQSTNEELQSTNEELTTSKEEMQAVNEELQTVNQELESKVDQLLWTSNDMKNLLNSTDIATLFLDDELNVRRFTSPASRIINLIPGDVGRPITDISSALLYPDLAADSREVLRTLVPGEKHVSASDGRWFKVRTMPYRTQDNRIDGLVITFMDITDSKTLESALQESRRELNTVLQLMPSAFALFQSVFNKENEFISFRFLFINSAYEKLTGVRSEDVLGRTIHDVWPGTEADWVRSFGEVANSGVAKGFELRHGPTHKLYHCDVYRPGESRERFFAVLNEITAEKIETT